MQPAALLVARDAALQTLGVTLVESQPGRAALAMPAVARHLDAGGRVHGGVLYTLAYGALVVAANHDGQSRQLAQVSIEYMRAVQSGESLVARARLMAPGQYEATVEDADGLPVALLRAQSGPISA